MVVEQSGSKPETGVADHFDRRKMRMHYTLCSRFSKVNWQGGDCSVYESVQSYD